MKLSYNTTNIPNEIKDLARKQIDLTLANLMENANNEQPLKQYKVHKSCSLCGVIFSKKENDYYCRTHPNERRNIETTKVEAQLLHFIELATAKLDCVGVRIYSTTPNSGEKIKIQNSYYSSDLSNPAKGASVIIRLARYLLTQVKINPNNVFQLVDHCNSAKKIVLLAPGADKVQAASAILAAVEAAKEGQYLHSRSVKIQLIGEAEVSEDLLNFDQTGN